MADEWLALKKTKRKPRIAELYKEKLELYIKPTFGDRRISSIKSREVQKWIQGFETEGYSSTTIKLIYTIFGAIIRYALQHEMIIKNPLNGIELPSIVKRVECVLEPEEAKKVLDAARQTEGGILPAFLLWTGCRPGEGCAVQWKDINWENGTVEIRRNVMRLHGGWQFGTPKTASCIRTVKLPRDFLDWLKQHRADQLERRLQKGSIWQDYDLVFPNEIGDPVPETHYRRLWKQILRAAGLEEKAKIMRA